MPVSLQEINTSTKDGGHLAMQILLPITTHHLQSQKPTNDEVTRISHEVSPKAEQFASHVVGTQTQIFPILTVIASERNGYARKS